MEATLYNQKGKESGKVALPAELFGAQWNADLVHQVVTGMMSNKRTGTADSRGRGDVAGGGKKPWKQKGTGRARHGSIRSPLWKGGGTTHGPLAEKNYTKKINKKMRMSALVTVLSEKNRKGHILFIDSLALANKKTKDAAEILNTLAGVEGFKNIAWKKKNMATIALAAKDAVLEKSFANLPGVSTGSVNDLNPVTAMASKYLIITQPEASFALLMKRLEK